MRSLFLTLLLTILWPSLPARADVIDAVGTLQDAFDEALLDVHGGRWTPALADNLLSARDTFTPVLTDPAARALWQAPLPAAPDDPLATAAALGTLQARLQHVAALELLAAQQAGHIPTAQEWRSVIKLPKFANSVEGALALSP